MQNKNIRSKKWGKAQANCSSLPSSVASLSLRQHAEATKSSNNWTLSLTQKPRTLLKTKVRVFKGACKKFYHGMWSLGKAIVGIALRHHDEIIQIILLVLIILLESHIHTTTLFAR